MRRAYVSPIAYRTAMTDISRYEQLGEAAYEAMYDARDRYAVKPHYEDACRCYSQAIAAAEQMGLSAEATRLTARRDHIQAVYNHQFR
jgi:hypothetical protein